MSKNLNISVLVSARDEYMQQLKCILTPLIIQGFNSIYQDAIKITNGKKVIYKFQELLKEIPNWNQTILQEESKRIKKKCSYIMDIVTAIFVTNVKILASVRLKGSKDDIRVKIPTSDIFIHGIYIEAAQHFFYDPFLFYHKSDMNEIQKNKNFIKEILYNSIDETIRRMLPFDEILQKYLADTLNNNAEVCSDSESENETISDSDEESINNDNLSLDNDEIEENDENDENELKIKSFNIGKNETTYLEENVNQPPPVETPQNNIDNFNLPPQINNELVYTNPTNDPVPNKHSDSESSYSSDASSLSDSSSERSHRHERHHKHRREHREHREHRDEHRSEDQRKDGYSFFD